VPGAVPDTVVGGYFLAVASGQQERCRRIGEAVWILPEKQMALVREGHEPSARDPAREQPSVARVDHAVRAAAMQDQRARQDARLPQAPGIQCSGGSLGRRGSRVRWLGALQLDKAIGEFWMVPDGARRETSVWRRRATSAVRPGSHQDQPHGGIGHRLGEGPARCRARKDETVDPLWVGNRQFLGHHPAQARPPSREPGRCQRH
jgi:hypothetical protein